MVPALIEVSKEGIIRVMGVTLYSPASEIPHIKEAIRIENDSQVRYQDLNIYTHPTLNIDFTKNRDGLINSIAIKNVRLTKYESNSIYQYFKTQLSTFNVEKQIGDNQLELSKNFYNMTLFKQEGFNYDMSKFPFAIIIKPTII